MNRKSTAAVLAAAALTAPLALAPSASADDTAAQERYVNALVVAHRDASAYTQMDDYVRVLEYWHRNPDWGLGS